MRRAGSPPFPAWWKSSRFNRPLAWTERHRRSVRCSRMLNGLGHVLLRGGLVGDDMSTEYRAHGRKSRSRIICFSAVVHAATGWQRRSGSCRLIISPATRCREPSSAPSRSCVFRALRSRGRRRAPGAASGAAQRRTEVLVVGLSIGNGCATYFANCASEPSSARSRRRIAGDSDAVGKPGVSPHQAAGREPRATSSKISQQAIRGYPFDRQSFQSGARRAASSSERAMSSCLKPRRIRPDLAVRRELPDSEITFLEET